MPLKFLQFGKKINQLLGLFFCLIAYPQLSANLVLDIDANNPASYHGSGNLINDLSSNNNDLRIVNDVTHHNGSDGISSFNFGGSVDYLTLNSPPFNNFPSGTSNYTIVMKIDGSASASKQYLINYGRSSSGFNGEFIFHKPSNGKIGLWDYFNGYGFSESGSAALSNSSLSSNSWNHVVFVKSGTSGKFFFNGVLDRSITAAKNVNTFRNSFFYVGGDVRDSNDWFNGKISRLKI